MIFARKKSYGVTKSAFLDECCIGYLNLCKVAIPIGLTIGNATSIDLNKKLCIKKSYSEYLERFALGIPVIKDKKCSAINITKKKISINDFSSFGYGDTEYGHNDTTATATGIESQEVINKALCELIEKNEVLSFWYSNCGKRIRMNKILKDKIDNLNFISDKFVCFLVNELSNYSTVIVLGIKGGRLITTGVSCTSCPVESFDNAIKEAKIIEWQQYNNIHSDFWNYSESEMQDIYRVIDYKSKNLKYTDILPSKDLSYILEVRSWIGDIYLQIIFSDEKTGLKTIKCVSDQLLSALPTYKNIIKSLDKEIVRRYFINKEVDCPIV